LAHPKAEGQRPEDLDQALEFTEGLLRLASQDAAVHKLFVEVLHLLKPQSVLQDPDLVERVKALAAGT
jgi:hypothetical protein